MNLREQSGNVYVEALVAVAILVFAILPLMSAFNLTPAVQDQAARNTTALNIARSRLEKYHSIGKADWMALPDEATPRVAEEGQDLNQPAYRVRVEVSRPDTSLLLKNITVTVSWTDAKGQDNSVTLATSVARRPW